MTEMLNTEGLLPLFILYTYNASVNVHAITYSLSISGNMFLCEGGLLFAVTSSDVLIENNNKNQQKG
jgi:hypothetical protein